MCCVAATASVSVCVYNITMFHVVGGGSGCDRLVARPCAACGCFQLLFFSPRRIHSLRYIFVLAFVWYEARMVKCVHTAAYLLCAVVVLSWMMTVKKVHAIWHKFTAIQFKWFDLLCVSVLFVENAKTHTHARTDTGFAEQKQSTTAATTTKTEPINSISSQWMRVLARFSAVYCRYFRFRFAESKF